MIRIEFENSQGISREIGRASSEKEANRIIKDFLDEHSYKSYYSRFWSPEQNHTIVDVGSHSEFFHLYTE